VRGRAAIYARYSSHNQREESIEIQLENDRAYAADNDLEVVAEYCDYAQTGRDTNRAQFQRMMLDARSGLFDYVVIYKVTRIMRNRDEMALTRVMLRRSGVEILYAGESLPEGSSGTLMLGFLEVLAEWESDLDSERIRDGVHKNAHDCKTNGCTIFGYKTGPDGKYEVDPLEAEGVRMAFGMVCRGETVAAVVRALEKYPTKRGGKWRQQTVTRLLRRPQYYGLYSYAGFKFEGGMPAIVSRETWDEAQAKLGHGRPRPRETQMRYVLTGKLFHSCGTDDAAMVGTCGTSSGNQGKYYYYRCLTCRMTVRKTTIEALVAQAARDALDNVETKGVVADLVISYEASVDGEPCQSEVIQKELDHIRLAYNRVWKAIEEGTVPPGGKERIDSLKAREELLLQELRTTRAIEGRRLTRDVIIGWLGRLDEMDPEEIIASFVERVWIDGDDVTIRFAFDKTVTVSSSGFSTAPPKTRRASTPCVSRCCGTRGIRPCGGAASTVVPPICELLSTTKQIVLIKFGACNKATPHRRELAPLHLATVGDIQYSTSGLSESFCNGVDAMEVKEKHVELVELFSDLIYVYAISRMTMLIEEPAAGIIQPRDFGRYLVLSLVVLQGWLYMTNYINRYGSWRWWEYVISGVNMVAAVYVSNTISSSWEQMYVPFNASMLVMLLTVAGLYFIQMRLGEQDLAAAKNSLSILGVVCLTYLLAGIAIGVGAPAGTIIWIDVIAVLIGAFLPFFMRGDFDISIINWPHLTERFELLVIVTFGEGVVGMAGFFDVSSLSLEPILMFIVLLLLFGCYAVQMHNLVDRQAQRRGLRLMFSHYLIVIAVNLVTVACKLCGEGAAVGWMLDATMVLSLVLFFVSLVTNSAYYKDGIVLERADVVKMALATTMGCAVVMASDGRVYAFLTGATLVAGLNLAVLYSKQVRLVAP